jgi:hypothetical protein
LSKVNCLSWPDSEENSGFRMAVLSQFREASSLITVHM